ncbi:MAG: SpoIIE family protein phosphatase [Acidimicrobiia bacterium]|nr:SpoIIE family protein phosphatase [Acidimicrobiia bacterium]
MNYQWSSASHPGLVRTNNEDSVHPEAAGRGDGPIWVMVADGMGGHVAGEVASRLAVDAAISTDGSPTDKVNAANTAILNEIENKPHLSGMGTTLTMARLDPDGTGHFGHVGDSRAYLRRDDVLERLTEDHTVVAEYVASGAMTEEEAAQHPQRSMITRALGLIDSVPVDTFEVTFQSGDRLLLCSDGVNEMLNDKTISSLLGEGTPEETVWAIVEAANSAGGQDNITALVVEVEE